MSIPTYLRPLCSDADYVKQETVEQRTPMRYRISFENSGGELDFRIARNEKEAKIMALDLIEAAPELHDGDKIIITEWDL